MSCVVVTLLITPSLFSCDKENPASASESVTLTIVNKIDLFGLYKPEITQLFVSKSNTQNWGNNQLGSGKVLKYDERFSIDLEKGKYDMKVVDEDGDEYIKAEHDLSSNYTWSVNITDIALD